MSHKHNILQKIRGVKIAPCEHPGTQGPWSTYSDLCGKFEEMLAVVGGQCVSVRSRLEIPDLLQTLPVYTGATQVYSGIEGIGEGNVEPGGMQRPHEMESVDFAIVAGELGVAENGAVWVSGAQFRFRSVLFLCQHLAIVLAADRLVSNMHEAYAALQIPDAPYGAFVSGPSKTADIEQSLVIGAHGPRSLTVFLVNS